MVIWIINQASMSNWEIALPLFKLGKTTLPIAHACPSNHPAAQSIHNLRDRKPITHTKAGLPHRLTEKTV